jgi:hypothetical protein
MSASHIVAKRRDRCLATILSFKEDEVDEYLDRELSNDLRKVILDSVNDVCSLAIDLLDDASIVNETFFERLEDLFNGES